MYEEHEIKHITSKIQELNNKIKEIRSLMKETKEYEHDLRDLEFELIKIKNEVLFAESRIENKNTDSFILLGSLMGGTIGIMLIPFTGMATPIVSSFLGGLSGILYSIKSSQKVE